VAPCSPCGSIGYIDAEAPDASVADVQLAGSVPITVDAGYDAHHPIGVVVEPPDTGSTFNCPPFCGIVVGVVPNPGH
jgi:hypothetical protein